MKPGFLNRYAPFFYMGLAMAMWAVIENIPRYFTQHYTSYQIVWMRYTVHMLFMLVVFGPRRKWSFLRTRKPGLQIGRGMLMMGMHLSFIFAVRFIPMHATMAGFWVAPLILLGLSGLRRERADALQWFLTAAAFGCTLVMLRPLNPLLHPAALLSIVMALCFVCYMQMTRAMADEDIQTSLFYTAFSVWVVLSALMPFYWVTPNLADTLLFSAIGLIGYVCLYGFDKAAELAPTWVSAPFGYTQPVLVLLTDWKLHGLYPGRIALGAAGLLIICLGVTTLRKYARQPVHGYHYA